MRSPILGGFSVSRSTQLADNELINLFPEIIETKDGKAPGALWMAPGLDLLATVGAGPIRGLHAFQDVLYVVSGINVYSVTPNWAATLLGTTQNLSTPVSMIDNGQGGQIAIFDGVNGYLAPGGQPLTGGTIGTAGQGYAQGDTITLAQIGGTQTSPAVLTVSTVSGTGAVTAFTVTQGGAFNPTPTSFNQGSTSGSGGGFALTIPTYGASSGLLTINLPFAGPVGKAAMIDGFGLIWEANTNKVWQSDELDLSTWAPLNFAFAQAKPDNGVSMVAIHDELYLLKTRSLEVWSNSGKAGFAFQPLGSGSVLEAGCWAAFSPARLGEGFAFLSQNDEGKNIVVHMRGFAPTPISTQAMVNELETYANTADAIGYSYQQGGHAFYVLSFPLANKTWAYDLTASTMAGYPVWHRRAEYLNGVFNRHWGNVFTRFLGAGTTTTQTTPYTPTPVTDTSPTRLATAAGLGGLTFFYNAVMSVWLDIPDDGTQHAIVLSNQTDDLHVTTNPGVFIEIANDQTGTTAQISIFAWDENNALVVSATYNFTTWTTWVNLLISFDTTTQSMQVYANTVVSGALVETQLTATSLVWASTNAIGVPAAQPWHVVTAGA